jgi:hypothetical protein
MIKCLIGLETRLFFAESLPDIGFHTLSLMNSTYPSTIWDKSSASYARALAKNSVSDSHRKIHQKQKQLYKCEHCPKTFNQINYLTLHQQILSNHVINILPRTQGTWHMQENKICINVLLVANLSETGILIPIM